MKPFVIYPEGDLFFIMQVCPDALLGNCAHEHYCDCWQSDDGPLWMDRGYCKTLAEAEERQRKLTLQFWNDVERSKERSERVSRGVSEELCAVARPVVELREAEDLTGWAVWRVCTDVLQVGECRDALWCSCEHSDVGPLRAVLRSFPRREDAEEFARVRQAEFDANPVEILKRWEARPVPVGAAGEAPTDAAGIAAFRSIDVDDVRY